MKKNFIHTAATLILLWLAGLSAGSAYIEESKETIATFPFSDPDPAAIIARHDSWDANSLGNHRVVIDVSRATGAVAVHIPWRRRDLDPQKKKVILIDAKTSRRIDLFA